MPRFFLHHENELRITKRWLWLALVAAVSLPATMPAQTLARPGWVGSGLTASTWWRHAVVYAIDTHASFIPPAATSSPSTAATEGSATPANPVPTPAPTPPSDPNVYKPYVAKPPAATKAAAPQAPPAAAPLTGLKGVAARMNSMQTLGVDAVLLRGIQSGTTAAIDPAAGTMDDFDEVLLQASRHNLRVLVELSPKTATEDLTGIARFWLSRGVAGFRLVAAGDSKAQMRQLRTVAKSYVGERVMIGDASLSTIATSSADSTSTVTPSTAASSVAPSATMSNQSAATDQTSPATASATEPAGTSGRHRRHGSRTSGGNSQTALRDTPVRVGDGPQLLLDASIAVAPLNVAAIRMALEKNDALSRAGGGVPMLATAEGAGGGPETGKVVATLLLSSRGGAMIRAGQEGSGDSPAAQSLSNWYKQMSAMQHSNGTIRTGINTTLNHDDQNVVAWVRRPQVVSYHSPAVVFLCNMTGKPVTLSLRADMADLHLKGNFLKTVARSDEGMGGMSLDTVTIAPYGVYVGELLY